MKAFVTGSTGLLGSNLVKQLLEQGHTVKALARSPEKARRQFGVSPALEVVKGDMEDIGAFAAALQGCDVVFHVAAYFREYFGSGDHWDKLKAINVTGTIRMLDEAEKHGVKKVIYVSSSGVIGHKPDGSAGDETTPPDQSSEHNLYFKSKVLAEQAVAQWLKTHALPVVLILPTWMWGPQDAAPTAAGRLVQDFLNQQIPAIPPGGSAVVDARDVAQAMINAVKHGKSGERYIISNQFQTLSTITQLLEKVSGVPGPKIHLPYPVALAVGWLSETAARLQGRDALITVNSIRVMKHGLDVSGAKAMRELGAQPRPFEETVRDSVTWFRANVPQPAVTSSKPA